MNACALIGRKARDCCLAAKIFCEIPSIGQIFLTTALSSGHFNESIYASRPLRSSIKLIDYSTQAFRLFRECAPESPAIEKCLKKKNYHLNYGTMRQLICIVGLLMPIEFHIRRSAVAPVPNANEIEPSSIGIDLSVVCVRVKCVYDLWSGGTQG